MKNLKVFFIWLGIAVFFGVAILVVARQRVYAPVVNVSNFKNKNQLFNSQQSCGIENCHGLEITCGSHIPKICSQEYQIGDACRQYARCQIQNGKCQLVKSDKFNQCKNCVKDCEKNFKKNSLKLSQCEGKCHLKINQTKKATPE